jgi:hypothetical protein
MILKNGIDLYSKTTDYIEKSESLYIFSAYIKLNSLKGLIDFSDNIKAVIVRWEPNDIIQGSSDLEIYPFLKEKGIALYRNPRLHLKAYIDNYRKCFLTTANISSRALNMPPHNNYNYEIGTIVENLTIEDRLYFQIIESESILITDDIYNQIVDQISDFKNNEINTEDFDLKIDNMDKNFLISALPLSMNIDKVYSVYKGESYISEEDINCALHDLAIYKIPLGLSRIDFIKELTDSFFSHPFIKKFIEFLETTGIIYFGAAKEWIHKNCIDVPLPRKWEVTKNIQILYRWIVELGNGKYAIDRPSYSERLYVI